MESPGDFVGGAKIKHCGHTHCIAIRKVELIIRKKLNLTLSTNGSFILLLYTHGVLSSGILIRLSLLVNTTKTFA